MNPLPKEIRHNPLLWLPVFVPVAFAAANRSPETPTLSFLPGGLRHHVQEYNKAGARLRAGLLFLLPPRAS